MGKATNLNWFTRISEPSTVITTEPFITSTNTSEVENPTGRKCCTSPRLAWVFQMGMEQRCLKKPKFHISNLRNG